MANYNPFRFVNKKTKPVVETTPEKYNKSVVPPQDNDGSLETTVYSGQQAYGQFQSSFIDMHGAFRSDADLIAKYREMAMQSEPDEAIQDIINEAIITDSDAQPVSLNMEDIKVSEKIKETITEEFDNILKMLNFEREGQDIFRQWYVDGKLYYHAITEKDNTKGISELRYIDPIKIRKVKEVEKETDENGVEIVKGTKEYYIFTEREANISTNPSGSPSTASITKIAPEAICHCNSGIIDRSRKSIISYLHKAIRPLNQLRMIENAVVIYRIARAPERRVFYIDVGNMPPQKAEQYIQELMNKYRNRLAYNPDTGQLQDDKKHMHMLEDYWMPRRSDGKGTEISTLQGGQNLGQLEDVEYFLRKLYKSLNVPVSRIDGNGTGFNLGRASEITRDEVKFSKFIFKLRTRFAILFDEILKRQLILKKIITPDEWEEKFKHSIRYVFAVDTYFEELKDAEILRERIATLNEMREFIAGGGDIENAYFTKDFVYRNVLHFSDKEIQQLKKAMVKEAKEELEFVKEIQPVRDEIEELTGDDSGQDDSTANGDKKQNNGPVMPTQNPNSGVNININARPADVKKKASPKKKAGGGEKKPTVTTKAVSKPA